MSQITSTKHRGAVVIAGRLLALSVLALVLTGTIQAAAPEPVELRLDRDGIELAGALYLPPGEGPFAAVVVTHGSECGHRKLPGYIRWAERIRDRGLAALLYDKRGCGDSGGSYVEAPDLEVPASDVVAWAATLKARKDIRGDRIGVIGWSQGGWVGPLAASHSSDLSFVVAVSGPGVPPLEQNIYDKTNQFRATGATEEQVKQFERTVRSVWSYITYGTDREQAQAAWDAVHDQEWFQRGYNGPPMMDRDRLLQHPRMQSYVPHQLHDAIAVMESLKIPMLFVFGGADTVVPVETSIERLRAAARSAGNDRVSFKVFPGADHGVRVEGGRPAAGFHDFVLDWFESTAKIRG